MGISFGVSYILFQEIKITRDIGNSVVAFYAAESGIEELMMNQEDPKRLLPFPVQDYHNVRHLLSRNKASFSRTERSPLIPALFYY